MFSRDGFFASTFGQSWNQFKFGGQPGNQQFAFYVNLKDILGLRYGTQNPIRYKDANYANTFMLAVTSNGTYTVKVVDPILLFKNVIPADIVSGPTGKTYFEPVADMAKLVAPRRLSLRWLYWLFGHRFF